jgi:hypothetical protein
VNADGDTHEHVLGTLCDTTIDPQKVGPFQGLEAEADFTNKSVNQPCFPHIGNVQVVVEIAIVYDTGIQQLGVFHDDIVRLLADHSSWFTILGINEATAANKD